MFFALLRKKPVLWITFSSALIGAAAIAAGVGQRRNSSGVTMFTRSSVHWAERIVAIKQLERRLVFERTGHVRIIGREMLRRPCACDFACGVGAAVDLPTSCALGGASLRRRLGGRHGAAMSVSRHAMRSPFSRRAMASSHSCGSSDKWSSRPNRAHSRPCVLLRSLWASAPVLSSDRQPAPADRPQNPTNLDLTGVPDLDLFSWTTWRAAAVAAATSIHSYY